MWAKWIMLLLTATILSSADGHFVNSSLIPFPGPIRHYTLNNTNVKMIYQKGDCGCFCKIDHSIFRWTVCLGEECVNVPLKVKVYNQRLRVQNTAIKQLTPVDFIDYKDLVELQLDGNKIKNITQGTFEELSSLVNLSVSFNELKSLQPGSLRGLSSLQNLRLSNNHFINLSSVIPALADLPELRTLSLDENALGRIEANDFLPLANSSLEMLDLNNCDIRYISPEAFLPLVRLRHLILSSNIVTNDNLVHVFHTMQDHHSRLKAISLSGFNFAGSPPRELLSVLSKMDVDELDLSKNTLPTLNNVTFPLMANVLELDLNSCGIISIENGTFDHFPSLRRLNLAFNRLGQIPAAVASLDQLQWLSLSENSGRGELELVDYQLSTMIHLIYLDLSNNNIGKLSRAAFVGLSRLEHLVLNNGHIYRLDDGCFHPLGSLQSLNLSNNGLSKDHMITKILFQSLVSLEELSLDNCKIASAGIAAFSLPKLERLYLAGNVIRTFNQSSNPFTNASALVSVDLSRNQLRETAWADGPLFNSSSNLQNLNLAANQISSVTPNMMKDFAKLSEIDLLGNQLDCDCQLEPLRRYALNHEDGEHDHALIKADHCAAPDEWRFFPVTSYLVAMDVDDCNSQNSSRLFDDDPTTKTTKPYIIALYVVIPLFILFIVIGYALYRARWIISYYRFRKRLQRSTENTAESSGGDFNYDAFISYSSEDQNFVARMVGMLENHPPNYKLCVYERDFTAGNAINDCIASSITSSRKVVLIVSRHFVQSHWCLWELHLAQHSLLDEQRNGLVLVVVGPEKLKPIQLPPTLRYLMKTRIYLEWHPVDPVKQKVFWERLRAALAPSPSIISSSS